MHFLGLVTVEPGAETIGHRNDFPALEVAFFTKKGGYFFSQLTSRSFTALQFTMLQNASMNLPRSFL